MPGKDDSERINKLEFQLAALDDKVEKRLGILERRLEMENYALTGLRWVVAVTGAAAIVAVVQRLLG